MATTEQSAGPPPRALTSSEPFASGHGRAQVLIALFMGFIAVKCFSVVSNLMQISLIRDAIAHNATHEQLVWNDLRQEVLLVLTIIIIVANVIALLVWVHRVARNLPALGNPKSRVEYTPGWAVGSFFVPIGNLFMPYRALREAWLKSDPAVRTEAEAAFPPHSSTSLLMAWWVSWILLGFITRAASRLHSRGDGLESLMRATWVYVVASVVGIVSAVLGVFVVRELDRRQEERSRNVTYAPHTPPPPLLTPPPPPTFSTANQS